MATAIPSTACIFHRRQTTGQDEPTLPQLPIAILTGNHPVGRWHLEATQGYVNEHGTLAASCSPRLAAMFSWALATARACKYSTWAPASRWGGQCMENTWHRRKMHWRLRAMANFTWTPSRTRLASSSNNYLPCRIRQACLRFAAQDRGERANSPLHAAFAPDGRHIAVFSAEDFTLHVFETARRQIGAAFSATLIARPRKRFKAQRGVFLGRQTRGLLEYGICICDLASGEQVMNRQPAISSP